MELVENSPMKIVLRMPNNHGLANALRRSVNEVPVLAIDEVEIHKNDSALYDEFLTHRIGLVPLKTEHTMNEKTEVELKLVKSGPGVVLSGDFKGGAEVVYPGIPLTLLEKDQEIELVATARMGTGTMHDKYSPGICFYRHLVSIKSKNPHVIKLVENSRGLIKPEKGKDSYICDLNEAQVDDIEKLDPRSTSDSDEIILIIESFGQLPAKEILLRALRTLGENFEAFEKALT